MTIIETDETKEVPSEDPVLDVEEAFKDIADVETSDVDTSIVPSGSRTVTRSADWSINRKASIKVIMSEKKKDDRIPLGENIYSLFLVSPINSWPFVFCCLVYSIKIIILSILLSDIDLKSQLTEEPSVTVVKFCLVPVAVAMQEDMMYSFFFYANVIYSPECLKHSKSATMNRFIFSYTLRTIDGILSLFSNYFIMLITPVTLDVFLNFAALQFLYDIDDVFYELVTQGFFGDVLEGYSKICRRITMERRFGSDNTRIFGCLRISWLDTVLFCISLLICYIILSIVTAARYIDDFNFIIGTEAPTMSPMPSFMPSSMPSTSMPSSMPSDFPSLFPSLFVAASNATDDAIFTDDAI